MFIARNMSTGGIDAVQVSAGDTVQVSAGGSLTKRELKLL